MRKKKNTEKIQKSAAVINELQGEYLHINTWIYIEKGSLREWPIYISIYPYIKIYMGHSVKLTFAIFQAASIPIKFDIYVMNRSEWL